MEKIVLLHDSFVSEILLDYVKQNRIPVFAEGALAKKLLQRGIRILSKREAEEKLSNNAIAYSNSENFIPVLLRSPSSEAIRTFKNKALFRSALAPLFPDFYFKQIKRGDAGNFKPPEGKQLILKPSIGFWSVGVIRFSGRKNFERAFAEAMNGIRECRKNFNASIIDEASFLVEECLEGEEYACDAYFDADGFPVVLGIYRHPFRDREDVRDLVYFTGRQVVEKTIGRVEKFLSSLSQKAKLENFPLHFEFIINAEGELIPIEVNPMRFGGFGLADLIFHCFGINPYKLFFEGKKPDWEKLLARAGDDYHAFVLGRSEGIHQPDIKKFGQTFQKLHKFIEMDSPTSPVFCIAYTQSRDLNEILKYLHFDFGEYELKA